MSRIKKNDSVMVISGKYKGKQGNVIEVLSKKNKVMVQGVAIGTHFVKSRGNANTGGIKKSEMFINIAKVMPVCGSCKKPCRINVKKLENGKNARICNCCKEIF